MYLANRSTEEKKQDLLPFLSVSATSSSPLKLRNRPEVHLEDVTLFLIARHSEQSMHSIGYVLPAGWPYQGGGGVAGLPIEGWGLPTPWYSRKADPPSPCEQTNMSKNITSSQLRLLAAKTPAARGTLEQNNQEFTLKIVEPVVKDTLWYAALYNIFVLKNYKSKIQNANIWCLRYLDFRVSVKTGSVATHSCKKWTTEHF